MLKKIIIVTLLLLAAIGLYNYVYVKSGDIPTLITTSVDKPIADKVNQPTLTVVAENLDTPWSLVFLPDGNILVAERQGNIWQIEIDKPSENKLITKIDDVIEIGEGGLLGLELHPDFENNKFLYLYYTYKDFAGETLNRVARAKYEEDKIINQQIIIDDIPGASNHNGGRIKFGPDKLLYITTGDAQNPSTAQDINKLSGKILRVTDNGKPAAGNPFKNLVYSYGHRNPQGLAWDEDKQLYSTEHGRSGLQSGLDEFNKIDSGKNYGWPTIQGNETGISMTTPILHSGNNTWAPAGLAYLKGSFYFGGLRGTALYKITLNNGEPVLSELYKNEFGRIRDVVTGPDGMLYITTSNRDGRGLPKSGDDKIIRINPQ